MTDPVHLGIYAEDEVSILRVGDRKTPLAPDDVPSLVISRTLVDVDVLSRRKHPVTRHGQQNPLRIRPECLVSFLVKPLIETVLAKVKLGEVTPPTPNERRIRIRIVGLEELVGIAENEAGIVVDVQIVLASLAHRVQVMPTHEDDNGLCLRMLVMLKNGLKQFP